MLVRASAEAAPIQAPWYDVRTWPPMLANVSRDEDPMMRRVLKSHMPLDALPVYAGVKFVHVARDGRDLAMSFHNHMMGFTPSMRKRLEKISRSDSKFGDAPPRPNKDPSRYFRDWLDDDGGAYGDPGASYFHIERSYWDARHDPNLLLVHFNDLKNDRGAEIARVARFLEIEVPPRVWRDIVEAASFERMRAEGDALIPDAWFSWDQGAQRFFHKGANGRWRDVVDREHLEAYEAKVAQCFAPEHAAWLANGRMVAGDPTARVDHAIPDAMARSGARGLSAGAGRQRRLPI